MFKKSLAGALLASSLFAVPAFANTTAVACTGYVISMSDEVAIQGEALTGGSAAFQRVVCERSASAADLDEGFTIIPVFIEELGIATRVVISVTGQPD